MHDSQVFLGRELRATMSLPRMNVTDLFYPNQIYLNLTWPNLPEPDWSY